MVKVYFESKTHAELAAIFDTEELYLACLPVLELSASLQNMIVTESIEDKEINELK